MSHAIAIGAIITDLSAQFFTAVVPTPSAPQTPNANRTSEVSEPWLAAVLAFGSGLSVALTLGCLLLLVTRIRGRSRLKVRR